MALDKILYRQILGHFATGVSLLTTRSHVGPAGMTINSFCSVSLDPPLILVCVDRKSHTLTSLRESGIFAVNILTDQQEQLARAFARPSDKRYDTFCGARYSVAATGSPIIDDALAFIDARTVNEYPGGDHVILLGEVQALGMGKHRFLVDGTQGYRAEEVEKNGPQALPLTFYRGTYRSLLPDYHYSETLAHPPIVQTPG